MSEPTDPFADIAAKLQAEREAEVLRTADMFTFPAICNICGAHVAVPARHKAFHDALNQSVTSLRDYARDIGRAAGVIPDA